MSRLSLGTCLSNLKSALNVLVRVPVNSSHDQVVTASVIFVTKIKTRTRIIGHRFQKTRTRITVIQKNENEIKTKISTNKTNEYENYCSQKRKMLTNNVILIAFPTNAPHSCAECDTC